MLDPSEHVSPFDVNMAADTGYGGRDSLHSRRVEKGDGSGAGRNFLAPTKLRPPNRRFFGGKDAILALDMMKAAKEAMVPPFELSTFADPAGSFTTAAAMVACVEKILKDKFNTGWKGVKVSVFGATGVVGFASSIIAALEGADVQLVAHRGVDQPSSRLRSPRSALALT